MAYGAFDLSVDEVNYLVAAILVTAAGFTAFSGVLSLENAAFYLAVSMLVLGTRELGQRTVAQWMDADVELDLSVEGSALTLFGGFIAVLTDLPFILLFPVSNSFSVKSYEQWGKDIDAMWSKRMAWIVYGGITALLAAGGAGVLLDFGRAADVFFLFAVFQMMPFDNHSIPTGELDGAYILRENGFSWLLFMFLSLTGFYIL